jgi:hypothetical protein
MSPLNMKSLKNEITTVKDQVFTLIVHIDNMLSSQINKDKIDSQSIFAFTKLIDSFIKLSLLAPNQEEVNNNNLLEEDKLLLKMYERVAPRAGFEPATKRLTAACSTTELPGNNPR